MEELRYSDGDVEVIVLPEAGARFHRLRAFGHDLLRTPDDPDTHHRDPFFWGAYVMAPWGGRVEARPTIVGSRTVDLAANFRDGTAIHGQVYDRPWTMAGDGSLRIRGGDDGWPWPYEVSMRIEVADATVRIELALTNLAEDRMPAGIGIHPWFRRPIQVAIHADRVHTSNTASTPEPESVSGAHDLRALGEMADDLDATWTDLVDPPVELRWPRAGIAATIRVTTPSDYIVAASPGEIDAIAVEAQTHAPQGLRRMLGGEPGGLTWLEPGESLELVVGLAVERVTDGQRI